MIDIDALFEDYMRKYLAANAGKFSEEELEDKVPEIYEKFGNAPTDKLGGKSPKDFFAAMDAESLVSTLVDCVKNGVNPSDFLCEAIESCRDEKIDGMLAENVDGEKSNDELSTYCVNLLNSRGSEVAFGKYLEVILGCSAGESLLEIMTETLSEHADSVKETVLSVYGNSGNARKYLVEILSSMSPDERVYRLLVDEFIANTGDTPLYVSYLVRYGDERAIDLFKERIKSPDLSYLDFKELKLGIEALGGECDEERDFTSDKYYKQIKNLR